MKGGFSVSACKVQNPMRVAMAMSIASLFRESTQVSLTWI